MFHWRAVKGNSYYYINSYSMEVFAATEMDSEEDRMRYGNSLRLNQFLMIRKECYVWVGHIVEYRGMTLRKVRPGKYVVISPCSLVYRPVYIDKDENLNVL